MDFIKLLLEADLDASKSEMVHNGIELNGRSNGAMNGHGGSKKGTVESKLKLNVTMIISWSFKGYILEKRQKPKNCVCCSFEQMVTVHTYSRTKKIKHALLCLIPSFVETNIGYVYLYM